MPTAKGFGVSVRSGKSIGCNVVQVFTSSPQQWRGKTITDEMAEEMRLARKETGIDLIISHDSYLINLAATEDDLRNKSIGALVSEMQRCEKLGIPYAVSHMGAHKGEGEEKGLERLAESAAEVLGESPDSVSIAMETTAGQGTTLGWRFEQLASVIDANKGDPRLVVCLDTCHIFSAGYDIRTEETYETTMSEFDRTIGFGRLKVIHVNDSMKPFAERKDRHAHIGEGEIGEYPFRRLVNDPRVAHAPLIIETPEVDTMHEVNLRRLISFIEN